MINEMIPRERVMALEEPACAMANNAELALAYITALLLKLRNDGAITTVKANAASHVLAELANAADELKDATYKAMEPVSAEPMASLVSPDTSRDLERRFSNIEIGVASIIRVIEICRDRVNGPSDGVDLTTESLLECLSAQAREVEKMAQDGYVAVPEWRQ
jgi:hypothetical protein